MDESPVGLSTVEPLVVEWRLDDFGNSGMSLAAEFCDLKLLRLESTKHKAKDSLKTIDTMHELQRENYIKKTQNLTVKTN